MSSKRLLSTKNILTVVFIGLLTALMAFSFSLWQTPSYKSTIKLLTVFNQSNIDAYTASKTANYITGILGEVVYSDSFVKSVYQGEVNLIDNLGPSPEKRQKNWKKIVKAQILDNKGIIIIDVYGESKSQVNLLASAISNTVITQHGLYDGSQDRVAIKMIDAPSIYESWSTFKILSDSGLGFLAGLLIGFTLIIVFPNHRLFEFKNKNKLLLNFPTPSQSRPRAYPAAVNDPQLTAQTETQNNDYVGRFSNPWLNQYYEENLKDNFDANN